MSSQDSQREDFERWARETGYPLTDEPGSLAGKPLGNNPGDNLYWARIENIPLQDIISLEEIEQLRPPENPDEQA